MRPQLSLCGQALTTPQPPATSSLAVESPSSQASSGRFNCRHRISALAVIPNYVAQLSEAIDTRGDIIRDVFYGVYRPPYPLYGLVCGSIHCSPGPWLCCVRWGFCDVTGP